MVVLLSVRVHASGERRRVARLARLLYVEIDNDRHAGPRMRQRSSLTALVIGSYGDSQ